MVNYADDYYDGICTEPKASYTYEPLANAFFDTRDLLYELGHVNADLTRYFFAVRSKDVNFTCSELEALIEANLVQVRSIDIIPIKHAESFRAVRASLEEANKLGYKFSLGSRPMPSWRRPQPMKSPRHLRLATQ